MALITLNIVNLCLYHLLQPILTQALPYQIFELKATPPPKHSLLSLATSSHHSLLSLTTESTHWLPTMLDPPSPPWKSFPALPAWPSNNLLLQQTTASLHHWDWLLYKQWHWSPKCGSPLVLTYYINVRHQLYLYK